jgi:hypothetical protein
MASSSSHQFTGGGSGDGNDRNIDVNDPTVIEAAVNSITGNNGGGRKRKGEEMNNTKVKEQRIVNVYQHNDKSKTFKVILEKKLEEGSPDSLNIDPLLIGRKIHRIFEGINNIKKTGRNKLTIELNSAKHANDMALSSYFSENNMECYIPSQFTMRYGVIKNIDTAISEEEIVQEIKSKFKVINARRLNTRRKIEGVATFVPNRCVVLTFESQILPDRVFLYNNSLPVDFYILPVKMCHKCIRFGHTMKQCKSTKHRCNKCAGDHAAAACEVELDNLCCLHCKQNHMASDSTRCMEWTRQKNIKISMARENKSYQEIAKEFKNNSYVNYKNSYANIVANNVSNTNDQKGHYRDIPGTSPGIKTKAVGNNNNSFVLPDEIPLPSQEIEIEDCVEENDEVWANSYVQKNKRYGPQHQPKPIFKHKPINYQSEFFVPLTRRINKQSNQMVQDNITTQLETLISEVITKAIRHNQSPNYSAISNIIKSLLSSLIPSTNQSQIKQPGNNFNEPRNNEPSVSATNVSIE